MRNREIGTVAILCATWGVVNFDVVGINYLMPFIAPSLNLNNTEIGILIAGFWLMFAAASFAGGWLSDRLGKHKLFLLTVLLLFAVSSITPGFAKGFAALLAARLLLGLVEGPVLPLSQAIVALTTPVGRRGTYMGIVQNLGSNIIAGFIAPLLLVYIATKYNWRVGFFLAALPGVLCATLICFFLPTDTNAEGTQTACEPGIRRSNAGISDALRFRNIWICALSWSLILAYVVIGFGFLPLFLVNVRHLSPHHMSLLMSVIGISGVLFGVAVPALSDRFGRKSIIVTISALGVFCPLGLLWYAGPISILALLVFLYWIPVGVSALVLGAIPSETVPAASVTTAIGFISAVGTFLGGVVAPATAGWCADHWGLSAPLILQAAFCFILVVLSFAMKEREQQPKFPIVAPEVHAEANSLMF